VEEERRDISSRESQEALSSTPPGTGTIYEEVDINRVVEFPRKK